ncbi:MAG: hypothetical protein WBD59_04945, partial [Candidatus Sulfotelmatobacter sp.]
VNIADQSLSSQSVGKVILNNGQTLVVHQGKVEVLLTPGVFLRVGDHSSVTMLSNGLANTEVRLDRGHAMVEVDDIYKQNDLRVIEGNVVARMVKPGLYDFNLRQGEIRVFDGQAEVQDGDKLVKVDKGHELAVAPEPRVKAVSFKKKDYEDGSLYNWSSLRSSYLAEANINEANMLAANDWGWGWGAGFWGPGWGMGWGGWGWDPWFASYTFMPWGGTFFSPFGWGFYSPYTVYRAPLLADGNYMHHFDAANVHAWGAGEHYVTSRDYSHGVYTGAGAERGAFHSGAMMARNGGFHGGAEGFHGEGGFHGGGGGFHGGGGFGGGGHGR